MVSAVVNMFPSLPILLAYPGAFFPLFVMNVAMIVVMLIREHVDTGHSHRQHQEQ